jgi:hypothetical protein
MIRYSFPSRQIVLQNGRSLCLHRGCLVWIESPQGIARRNGIKSVHQGRRSSSVSSQSELTKCVPLEHWRDSFPSHLQESPKLSQMPCRCGFWEGSHPNFGNSGRPYTHRQYLLRVEMTVSPKRSVEVEDAPSF